jgi:hypothetical protein
MDEVTLEQLSTVVVQRRYHVMNWGASQSSDPSHNGRSERIRQGRVTFCQQKVDFLLIITLFFASKPLQHMQQHRWSFEWCGLHDTKY